MVVAHTSNTSTWESQTFNLITKDRSYMAGNIEEYKTGENRNSQAIWGSSLSKHFEAADYSSQSDHAVWGQDQSFGLTIGRVRTF